MLKFIEETVWNWIKAMQHRGKNIEFKKINGNLVARKVTINKRIKIKSGQDIKVEKLKISNTGTKIRLNKRY